MQFLIFPIGFILWFLAYDTKPKSNDDVSNLWEQENIDKRVKLLTILNESFYSSK